MVARCLVTCLLTILGGCGSQLPTYDAMSPDEAWEIVRSRAQSMAVISAEADVILTNADGESMRVDAAVVLGAPDRARFRAWKVGHAVLDVASNDDGVWIDAPAQDKVDVGVDPAALARGLLLIPAWNPGNPASSRIADDYEYTLPTSRGDLTCMLDRRTLVVRSWRHTDESMILDDYRLIGDVPWPFAVELRSGDRSVRIRFRRVDMIDAIDPRAFTPPATARRAP